MIRYEGEENQRRKSCGEVLRELGRKRNEIAFGDQRISLERTMVCSVIMACITIFIRKDVVETYVCTGSVMSIFVIVPLFMLHIS